MPHIRYSVKAVIIEALVILSLHFEIGTETLLTTATPPTANLHRQDVKARAEPRIIHARIEQRMARHYPQIRQFGRSHSPNQTLHSIAQHTNLKL